ncbi:MAG: hypothetical protein GY847_00070 [Proteobacteria bacterium]|nr:hypothetical protein [Pseudomonadota bacterium]
MVTGIGTVSAAAMDAKGFVEVLKEGKRCFTALEDPRLEKLTATHAGLISGLEPNPEDPREVRVLDRNVHLSLKALREALMCAGCIGTPLGPRAGVVFGTCSGGMLSIEKHYEGLAEGVDLLDEDLLFSKRYYTTAKILAWAAGASGPALTVVTACAAGAGAIAQGADLIRAGLTDIVLAGGSDTFAPSTLVGFDALKATCEGMCAPFSKTIGLNLGEGAAFFVLEDLDHALSRGADIIAELLGSGLSNDAYHPTAPDPSAKGQMAAMERALRDAGAEPKDIEYVNAHGTGTRANDSAESRAVGRLLEHCAYDVPVSSTKSMIGHCLGAAGALEASATILAARAGFVPPTAGFEGAREGCKLADYVPDAGRKKHFNIFLANSFGFGGNNASLLIDTAPESEQPAVPLHNPPEIRAVITGLGLVSPLGFGLDALISSSKNGIAEIERFETPGRPFAAGLVPPVDPRHIDRRLDIKGMDLCSKYATLAARSALQQANLKPRPSETSGVGMVMGLATGPNQGESDHLNTVFKNDFRLDRLGAFPYVVPNEAAGHVARALMLKGHNTVLAAGQGAGLAALISAAIAVEQGHVDTILASSADELTPRTVADGYRMGLWGPEIGIAPGEGAAALVIESPDAAVSRGVKVLAEIIGYALTTDVDDPRRGSVKALIDALNLALERSGIRPSEIQIITSGCNGSSQDAIERRALENVFGNHGAPIVSLTNRLGFAEATLPLFELSYAIAMSDPGAIIATAFISPEGFAGALINRNSSVYF